MAGRGLESNYVDNSSSHTAFLQDFGLVLPLLCSEETMCINRTTVSFNGLSHAQEY